MPASRAPLIFAILCLPLPGQAPAALTSFEVASIKPSIPVARMRVILRGGPGTRDPSRLIGENVSLRNLILRAYNVKDWEVFGPDWLRTSRFNIAAIIPEGATKQQFQLMMQNLLIERFQMKVHRESREMAVYELTVGKNGPKLKESAKVPVVRQTQGAPKRDADGLAIGEPGMVYVDGRIRQRAVGETMDQLALELSYQLRGPVHNGTGLAGKYDFDLEWASDDMIRATTPAQLQHGGTMAEDPNSGSSGQTIYDAVRSQLGLRLERKKGQVEVLVVDKVERRPTEN
jgi:uncharacterized protein (TIGR03435 family)